MVFLNFFDFQILISIDKEILRDSSCQFVRKEIINIYIWACITCLELLILIILGYFKAEIYKREDSMFMLTASATLKPSTAAESMPPA